MESSFGRAESDIYRMDAVAYEEEGSDDASSSAEDFGEETIMPIMHAADAADLMEDLNRQQAQHQQRRVLQAQKRELLQAQEQEYQGRPPPITTDWASAASSAGSQDINDSGVEVVADEQDGLNNARVSFIVPQGSNSNDGGAMPSSSMMHFQNPKRYNANNFASPYPTQSVRTSAADLALEDVVADGSRPTNISNPYGRNQRRLPNRTPSQTSGGSSLLSEVTPAFLRRAAQDLGMTSNVVEKNNVNHLQEPLLPPNSLMNRRESRSSNNMVNSSIPDSSFYGADASALDGTFVSIRDLDYDDDVPSVDNEQWNSPSRQEGSDAGFATESTSLLGNKKNNSLSWQGGFFGSQMEKEDRKERMKMMRARKGLVSSWIWTARSLLWGGEKEHGVRGAHWEANHPIGGDFEAQRMMNTRAGGLARQRMFSMFCIGILSFHLALCCLHDLFLRYLNYRNPEYEGEAEVSWNGEGQYIPAYWLSFHGRVLNPILGPGARTLTAFGAMAPGLVLSKGQGWRVGTALFQTSSIFQLILHVWVLKTVIGSSLTGLEWKRGTFVVVTLYLISSMIGSAWSIALEPGRLVTASGMGIAGLLAAAIVERACFPLATKDDEDETDMASNQNSNGDGSNGIAISSNEQFTFEPPNTQQKKRRNPLNSSSPMLLLLLEVFASWWAAHTSLVGTVTAATAGAACALLLFVGSPLPGSFDQYASQDLLLLETPPPPPPKFAVGGNWRDDDDSADTSIGSGRQFYQTPLIRRSILADEDEEDEPLGTRSSLRRRTSGGSSVKALGMNGRMVSIKNRQSFSASRAIARVVGVLLALLLTLIPASLIATGEGPSSEVTRASVLGCRPMRILYKEDDSNDLFECAGGCIPLSRERIARRNEGMRVGRCDSIGYRCWQQSGTMTLRNYDVSVGIYAVQSADGSCGEADEGEGNINNDDANNDIDADAAYYNGEVEGAQ